MSTNLNRTVIGTIGTALAAGVCLFAATAPAMAGTVGDTRTATVRYADLDLSQAAGRATLDKRIHTAAHMVCSFGGTGLSGRNNEGRCYSDAVKSATTPGASVTIASAE